MYNAGGATTSSAADDQIWPSMQDLNTRLRRVITSYQRNYKKEELKQQQKAKVRKQLPTILYLFLNFYYLFFLNDKRWTRDA